MDAVIFLLVSPGGNNHASLKPLTFCQTPGSYSRPRKASKKKIKESIGFMSTHRPDILWARGHIHIEKVIMTNVWYKDGDWNSIRYVSQWVLSTVETG